MRTVLCAGLLALSQAAWSQQLSPLRFSDQSASNPAPNAIRILEKDPLVISTLAATGSALTVESFPLSDGSLVRVRLSRVEVLAPGTKLTIGGPEGLKEIDPPAVTMLSGEIVGEVDSRVFLSFSEFGTNGIVLHGQTTEIISSGPSNGPIVMYRTDTLPAGLIQWAEHVCGSDALLPPPSHHNDDEHGFGQRGIPCRLANIAIETDWELTRDTFGGSTGSTAAYALTLIGAVSEIYSREFNTRLRVNFLRVWNGDTDPYSTAGTLNRLFEFQDWWNANMTGTVRNAAHILSGVRGEYGGVAYRPGLCQDQYDYGLSTYLNGFFPYPLINNSHQNWDVVVTAHEIGHNFGAPHTHNTSPPIDGCGSGDCSQAATGTIMSYCHTCGGGLSNIALTMHPRIVNENILPYLANDAPCNLLWAGPAITVEPTDEVIYYCDTFNSLSFDHNAVPPFTIQWYTADGTPIHDGTNPDGSRFIGTNEPTLSIHYARTTTPSRFYAQVGTSCGVTATRVVTAQYHDRADFNLDGFVDGFDYDDFVVCFEGDGCPPGTSADFNRDGFADGFDYDDFVTAFEQGCS